MNEFLLESDIIEIIENVKKEVKGFAGKNPSVSSVSSKPTSRTGNRRIARPDYADCGSLRRISDSRLAMTCRHTDGSTRHNRQVGIISVPARGGAPPGGPDEVDAASSLRYAAPERAESERRGSVSGCETVPPRSSTVSHSP